MRCVLRSFLLAAGTTLALSAASPAAAIDFVFNVTVETGAGDPNFVPVEFQQTFTWNPTFTTSSGGFFGTPPVQQVNKKADSTEQPRITATASPLFDVDNLSQTNNSQAFFHHYEDYDADGNFLTSDTIMDWTRGFSGGGVIDLGGNNESGDADDISERISGHATMVYIRFGQDPVQIPVLDEAGLRTFFATRQIGWIENYTRTVTTNFGDTVLSEETFNYRGFATLVGGAVPEPSTWAVMITGFGLSGAMLRRRRAVAA